MHEIYFKLNLEYSLKIEKNPTKTQVLKVGE